MRLRCCISREECPLISESMFVDLFCYDSTQELCRK